ncbi:MAG: hypothetical protein PHV93_04460 [Candidatus Pacebacteria bacterium]|nr:hypothetical protein [Candidatus Paceibacterota bacterium]
MENKEKIDSLKFMSETHRRELSERRRYEFKIVITVITFYVLAGASRFTGEFPVSLPCWFKVILWSAFLILVVVSSIFLRSVHNANYANKSIAERSESAIEALINGEDIKKINLFGKPFAAEGIKWTNLVWEVVAIILFAFASAVTLTLI